MQATGRLQRLPVQEPHRDSAPEQDAGRNDEERRKQPHRELRRAMLHIRAASRVVADEAPAGACQLQQDDRNQGDSEEDVPRHERVHPEQDSRDLDEDRSQQEHSHGGGQTLVSVRIHPAPT
jgi:hypothetical protein